MKLMKVSLLIVAILFLLHAFSSELSNDLLWENRKNGQLSAEDFIKKTYVRESEIEVVERIDWARLDEGTRGIIETNSGSDISVRWEDGHYCTLSKRDFGKIKLVNGFKKGDKVFVAQQRGDSYWSFLLHPWNYNWMEGTVAETVCDSRKNHPKIVLDCAWTSWFPTKYCKYVSKALCQSCPGGHGLKESRSCLNLRCNICRDLGDGRFSKNALMWSCRICDFDLCQKHMNPDVEGPPKNLKPSILSNCAKGKIFKHRNVAQMSEADFLANNFSVVFNFGGPWPMGTIYFKVDPSIDQLTFNGRGLFFDAVTEWNTKIKSIKWIDLDTHAAPLHQYFCNVIQDPNEIWASATVGWRSDSELSVPTNPGYSGNIVPVSTFLHEMMHVAGFEHEHQRHDRDNFVDVEKLMLTDINYELGPSNTGVGTYDFNSLMHYPFIAGQMIPKPQYKAEFIQKARKGKTFSQGDVMALNLVYGDGHHGEWHECKAELISITMKVNDKNILDKFEKEGKFRWLLEQALNAKVERVLLPTKQRSIFGGYSGNSLFSSLSQEYRVPFDKCGILGINKLDPIKNKMDSYLPDDVGSTRERIRNSRRRAVFLRESSFFLNGNDGNLVAIILADPADCPKGAREVRCGYLNENDLHEIPNNPGFDKLECRKGHELVKCIGNPYAHINSSARCNVCRVHHIENLGKIWRCDECEYDLCKECADTMFEIGKAFTFLPLNDMYRDSYSYVKEGKFESRLMGKEYSKSLPKRSPLCKECGKDHSEYGLCGPLLELMDTCKKDFSHWSCCFCTDPTSQKCKNSHDHTGLWHAKHVDGKGCGGTKCNCGNCGSGCLFVYKNVGHWGCCGEEAVNSKCTSNIKK